MPPFEAAETYLARDQELIVVAGKNYGCGSSRDWAAKGICLLRVRAVVCEGFERIHRTNLVGMGVLPLEFELGLDGSEIYAIEGLLDRRTAALPSKDTTMTHLRIPAVYMRGGTSKGGLDPGAEDGCASGIRPARSASVRRLRKSTENGSSPRRS